MSPEQDFDAWVAAQQQRIELVLQEVLPAADRHPHKLHQAMRYAVLEGGKRIRPLLVYASAQMLHCPAALADAIAAALELTHVYSLVHDDLPCMDNDALRRGKPTVWKAYDEATAMLVGDALQSLAFEVLANALLHAGSGAGAATLAALSRAVGSEGMCGGQQMDLDSAGKILSEETLGQMHQRKTGALLKACVCLPAIAMGAPLATISALQKYAQAIGLAFQITDDILDVTIDSTTLGKTAGKDAAQNKATYVTLLGLEVAREKAENLRRSAHQSLQTLPSLSWPLGELADLIVKRSS